MRDPRDPLPPEPELDELLDGTMRVDDHALRGLEHVGPGAPRLFPPREHVVGGEHDRPVVRDSAQPAQVELRPRQPLDMDDVGIEPLDAADEARDARRVLDALEREPCRSAAEEPRRERREELLAAVALGRRNLAVREARGQERHGMALASERRGERVVVGRCVRQRVDERDPHQTRERR